MIRVLVALFIFLSQIQLSTSFCAVVNSMGFLSNLIPKADIPTSATQPVPQGSQNAIRTTWIAPSSTVKTQSQAAADVKAAFEAYPQEGQNGVDKGGWEIADGSLDTGKFCAEFTSGSGIFAKLLKISSHHR